MTSKGVEKLRAAYEKICKEYRGRCFYFDPDEGIAGYHVCCVVFGNNEYVAAGLRKDMAKFLCAALNHIGELLALVEDRVMTQNATVTCEGCKRDVDAVVCVKGRYLCASCEDAQ